MQNIENVRRGRDYVWQKWKNFKKTDQKNPDPGAGCEDWFTAAFAGTDTGGRIFHLSWILTAALTFLYLKIMLDFSKKTAGVSSTDRKKGMENKAAENREDGTGQAEITILTVVYGIYGLADVFFLLCLFAEVAQCFLLPEQKIWMLILPAAASAVLRQITDWKSGQNFWKCSVRS